MRDRGTRNFVQVNNLWFNSTQALLPRTKGFQSKVGHWIRQRPVYTNHRRVHDAAFVIFCTDRARATEMRAELRITAVPLQFCNHAGMSGAFLHSTKVINSRLHSGSVY